MSPRREDRKNLGTFHYRNSCFDRCASGPSGSFVFGLLLFSILLRMSGSSNSLSSPLTTQDDGINRSTSDDYDYVDDVEPSGTAAQELMNPPMGNGLDSHPKIDANKSQMEHKPKGDENNPRNDEERNPSEIQKAVCTITAGEVRASAEAVTTKTLKGVCGSAELQLAFRQLEEKISRELETIKTLLLEKVSVKEQQPLNCISASPPTNSPVITQTPMPAKKITPPPIKIMENTSQAPRLLKLKSLQSHHPSSVKSRDKEVTKFNNTMLADKDVKIFTYYWRLENFTARIESGQSLAVDSPRFAIKGKPLHLKAYFQHLHRDFLYVQLEYAMPSSKGSAASPHTTGTSNNIILDMGLVGGGSLFKAISSNDQILFKYKISILDQQNLWHSKEDLISQEFHNLESGFLLPNSALLKSPYIKDDAILIQLFLYL